MNRSIRIASGQGFWGDWQQAPLMQVSNGPIDYLVMDYLAEVTMSILQKQKNKNPNMGYARDFINVCEQTLPYLIKNNIRLITNGGGVNPFAARDAVFAVAEKLGIKGLRIGVVSGDGILPRVPELLSQGIELNNMESGESVRRVADSLLSANVYFGAQPIVEALQQGAQIVITGRTTDTGLTLAPMIHEFGWSYNDWDKMAAGTIAGHINECGAQSTGGNFLGGWESVPNMHRIGFPIIEAYPDGTFVVTKHEKLGGLVSRATVAEQCLYEIGDPKSYITPDCVADFTTIHLTQEKKNRVRVHGIKGTPATEFYKVSMSYADGFISFGSLTYAWPDALKKARAADKVLRLRLKDLGLKFDETLTEYVGYDSCHGPLSHDIEPNEVVLRVGVRGHSEKDVARFGMEIAPLILTGPPTVTGFAGGRPKPSDVVAYWPALIKKTLVQPEVIVEERP